MEPLEKNDHKADQTERSGKPDLTTVSYQGVNLFTWIVPNVKAFQRHFRPHDTDIIVATKPKSGTTWLKSLVYSIVHRTRFTHLNHPLLTKNPHELVPSFEFSIYKPERRKIELNAMMSSMTSPRLFSTHLSYDILCESIKVQSECKIVYMARNPFDTVVSLWKFLTQIRRGLDEETCFEDFVEKFCRGEEVFGPHWDHVLGYWNESMERPNKVLFLMYEDMQEDGVSEMKKLAEFLGYGFSKEEEMEGKIQEILKLCSIDHLKNLEVNKTGNFNPYFMNSVFFRKGKVGDWINHMTPSMIERLYQVVRYKFAGSGLDFELSPQN